MTTSIVRTGSAIGSEIFAVGVQVRSFNWLMRHSRQAKGWSQAELAELAGASINIIGGLETLRSNYATNWDVLDRIAQLLEQPVERLFPSWLQSAVLREIGRGEIAIPLTEEIASQGADVMAGVIRSELYTTLSAALMTLNERERRVLDLRFGLSDGQSKTFREIAETLDCTPETIRQIEDKALRRLRHPARSKRLVQLWND